MKTILAPLDFSDVTPKVVETALDLARDLQAKVLLVHVIVPPIIMTGYGFTADKVPDYLLREEKEARKKLQDFGNRFKAEGIPVELSTVHGPPTESILLVAKEQVADLLVIGSHGHGGFYEFIVGSTTRGVLREFSGPVIIVPSRSAEEKKRGVS